MTRGRRTERWCRAVAGLCVAAGCSSGGSSVEGTPTLDGSDIVDASPRVEDTDRMDVAVGDHGTFPDGPPGTDVGAPPRPGADAGSLQDCSVNGAPGQCIVVSACAALPGHGSVMGHCAGPADVQCCIATPRTADNPPIPAGYRLMSQSQVTPSMTAWAVSILHDPVTYPMFATATMDFGAVGVLARVEWHPPDFQNGVVHRGVTLYVHG